MPVTGQDRELAVAELPVGSDGLLNRAEVVAVAGKDQRRDSDLREVGVGVAGEAGCTRSPGRGAGMSASGRRPGRRPGRSSSARTSAASAPMPRSRARRRRGRPRSRPGCRRASGASSRGSGASGSKASKPAWLTIARTASGCRMPRMVAVIAPSLKPAISGRSSPSASISAATSSASRSNVIGPPGCRVRPQPRVSGAITRKCSASASMCAGIRDRNARPDRDWSRRRRRAGGRAARPRPGRGSGCRCRWRGRLALRRRDARLCS